jgi:hypothetical protein
VIVSSQNHWFICLEARLIKNEFLAHGADAYKARRRGTSLTVVFED